MAPRQEARREVQRKIQQPIGNITGVSNNIAQLICSLDNSPTNFQGGQISLFIDNWKLVTSDPDILKIVSGSVIDFSSGFEQINPPPPLVFKQDEVEHMNHVIHKLRNNGVIKQVTHRDDQYLSNVFLRPKKDGSHRLILNLKHLNKSVEYNHFKMDTIKTALSLIRPNCFMACMDWKDAFYSVSIRSDYRKFLRFQWDGILFEFQCLVMGLSEAPRKFTKLTKPLWASLRQLGYQSVSYIDDALLLGDSEKGCLRNVCATVKFADSLGFTVHPLKSVLIPCQKLTFLGFEIDSVNMSVKLTLAKVEKIKLSCENLISAEHCSIRQLAKTIGQLVASEPGFPHAPLFYRDLEFAKIDALSESRGWYDAKMTLSQDHISLLQWWLDNVDSLEGPVHFPTPTIFLRSDSSDFAWGGVVMAQTEDGIIPTSYKTKGSWSNNESKEHINFKELKAAIFVLQSFCSDMYDVHIKLELDNTTAISYVNKMGGKIPSLSKLAKELWFWARERQIWVSASHIPGILNVEADALSRDLSDENKEWKLNSSTFDKINILWGPLQVDLFATRINCQLQRFISWHPDPLSFTTDAFLVSWNEFSYAFPPFSLVGRVLQKVEADSAEIVLIAPVWPTQPWFARLLRLCTDFPRKLKSTQTLLQLPQDPGHRHPLLPKMKLAAYRISGDPSRGRAFRRTLVNSCSTPGGTRHPHSTIRTSGSGSNFVQNDQLIPFQCL